ncbi:hypothetical protein PABG_01040 [Paracoccidioides brasiliensis Pb03]|nr:hypothetical protein PABG_01040 [Paracoccidioides brasiliensis Pb03]
MSLQTSLRQLLSILLPISITSLTYLYLYPIFCGCNFPPPASSPSSPPAILNTLRQHINIPLDPSHYTQIAPFRLLVLADPQLEGDTSLPNANDSLLNRLTTYREAVASTDTWTDFLSAIRGSLLDTLLVDIPFAFSGARKRLDLFGNDFYLAHIYRSLHWWTKPTHVTVLGDLMGSQWVTDGEFEWRAWRFWNRVFGAGVRVDDEITVTGGEGVHGRDVKVEEVLLDSGSVRANSAVEAWKNRIINVAGNHDVGYAGDISEARMERFDRVFGRANWDIRFRYPAARDNLTTSPHGAGTITTTTSAAPTSPTDELSPSPSSTTTPSIHLVVLNSLILDTPALSPSIQSHTYDFLNDVIQQRSQPVEDRSSFTLLLTHLPLHKHQGVCFDGPFFSFYDNDDEKPPEGQGPRFKAGGLREQNHLSPHASQMGILQGLFGLSGDSNAPAKGKGRNGLVLTGHDHVGCDVLHFVNRSVTQDGAEGVLSPGWSWEAKRYPRHKSHSLPSLEEEEDDTPSIREVTLRSMMGEFGGNAGFLSLWFDSDPSVEEWRYEISTCRLGVQHIWWTIHVVGAVTAILVIISGVLSVWGWLVGSSPGGAVTESTAKGWKSGGAGLKKTSRGVKAPPPPDRRRSEDSKRAVRIKN